VSTAPGEQRGEQRVSGVGGSRANGPRASAQQNIATAITDVSERVAVLVREEVELAKAEIAEKVAKLARGAVVAVAAGIFLVTALFLVLIGCAWLLYYVLPVPAFAYFWGFFAMALILVVFGALAGLLAARVVKRSAPPVPTMAIEEARRIRETMSAGSDGAGTGSYGAGAARVATDAGQAATAGTGANAGTDANAGTGADVGMGANRPPGATGVA
jgi:uncharacterized membrane protein YgcG